MKLLQYARLTLLIIIELACLCVLVITISNFGHSDKDLFLIPFWILLVGYAYMTYSAYKRTTVKYFNWIVAITTFLVVRILFVGYQQITLGEVGIGLQLLMGLLVL